MRDISTDLQHRVQSLLYQMSAETSRFENAISHLRSERDSAVAHLRAQLRLANKLLEFTAWQEAMRTELATRIAAAEKAENVIKDAYEPAIGD